MTQIKGRWIAMALLVGGITAVGTVDRPIRAAAAGPQVNDGGRATIGKTARDFRLRDDMRDVKHGEKDDAATISISSFRGKKPVLLFFMSDKCDTTWRYEKRVGQVIDQFGARDVAILGVRSSARDTPESIRKFAEDKNFGIPVLDDRNNVMADYYGVQVTPTFALIDQQGVLRYYGSFDDNREDSQVKHKYLVPAIQAVLSGREVAVTQTRPFG